MIKNIKDYKFALLKIIYPSLFNIIIMFKNTKLFIHTAFLGLILSSCGGHKEEEVQDEQVTTDTLSSEVRNKLDLVRVSIPSPMEVTKRTSQEGYNYNKNILNPTSRASGYSAKFQAAANLGVYGADLGYVAGYKQSQDVLEYIAQIAKLAKVVGVESAFDENLGKNLNDNSGKGDTLLNVIDQAYAKAERNLKSNDRVSVAAIVIAGGWIEGLYIATEIASSKPGASAEICHSIYTHNYAYTYVMELLNSYKKDADCAKMLEILTSAQPVLSSYSANPKLGLADVIIIKEAITPIRNKIVN